MPGTQKGLIFANMLKNLLRNHKVDEADTLQYPLHKLCFFYSDWIRTLDLLWEKWKLTVSAVSLEIFDFFLQICLLSSPPRFI